MRRISYLAWFGVAVLLAANVSGTTQAQVRLLGISGNMSDPEQPDETLYEMNLTDGTGTELKTLTIIPDSAAIGFNPDDGLLYHLSGGESWTSDPTREGGYRDHHYMETVNLDTLELTPLFNSNPPPSPDAFPSFGPAAPRPSWVFPEEIRLLTQTDELFQARGENEYHALRGVTWSVDEKLFYGSDEHGLFKMTPEGESTFVGASDFLGRNMKGIAFIEVGGETRLYAGSKRTDELYEIDPTTGLEVGDPILLDPVGGGLEFAGLLAIAQHPETGVVYGIHRGGDDNPDRELITLDVTTGQTELIGETGLHVASLAFVGTPSGLPRLEAGDANQDLQFDQFDLILVQQAALYLTGQPATWGQGDWNGAPGGSQGDPPAGDSLFNQLDIIKALNNGLYMTGPYAAINKGGSQGDDQTSIIYNATTGEVGVDAPAGTELTSINIDSAGSIFTGDPAENLGGSFDNDTDNNIFKATFGSAFGSLSFGAVAQAGLSEDFVANDLTVVGSLAGGGDLGNVDLIYVPEPSTMLLLGLGLLGALPRRRRS